MNATGSNSALERALLHLDGPPCGALVRIAVGVAMVPAWRSWTGGGRSEWSLVTFFLGTLLTIRVVSLGARRLFRFSDGLRAAWTERRQLAKRFDSYQWQKLFWIGWGLFLYSTLSGQRFLTLIILTLICVTTGGFGFVLWQRRMRRWNGVRREAAHSCSPQLASQESRSQA